jgi:hypothetical protein
MRFEFDFREKGFRKQQALAFQLKYGKQIRKYKTNLAYIILMFGLYILLISNRSEWGYFVLMAATILLVNNLYGQSYYRRLRKKLERLVDEEVQEFARTSQKIVCELSEEGFTYKDYKLSMFVIWRKFQSYKVIDNTLILHPFEKNFLPFLLDREELGDEQFELICQFIARKINA